MLILRSPVRASESALEDKGKCEATCRDTDGVRFGRIYVQVAYDSRAFLKGCVHTKAYDSLPSQSVLRVLWFPVITTISVNVCSTSVSLMQTGHRQGSSARLNLAKG